jgi:Mg-chelatase subunit ChlD
VSLQARGEDIMQIEETRPGLDLVCVIDTSGSMSGDKIALVKKTLRFALTKMTEWDRLSLVVFSNTARKLCRLIQCTENGKLELGIIID